MKKHWFLVVMLALISFTACKKENMIIGKWELIETEGVTDEIIPKGYVFEEFLYYPVFDGSIFEGGHDNEILYSGRYSIQNNTLTMEHMESVAGTWSSYTVRHSVEISFSGAKKMIWKDKKDKKIKYTFKKVTEFSDNGKNVKKIDYDSIFSNDQIIITTTPNESVEFEMKGTGRAIIDWGDGEKEMSNPLYSTDISYSYVSSPYNSSASNITIIGNVTSLICKGGVAKIDVSKNTALTKLVCNGHLTELNVSKNTALTYLVCNYFHVKYDYNTHFKGLTSLDVSNNTALAYLDCSNNALTTEALDALFETLHNNHISGGKKIKKYENPGTYDCDEDIAKNRGWNFN